MRPSSYKEWKDCITVSCGIPLTLDFVQTRIKALDNGADHHTKRFVEQWGAQHLEQTKGWFRQAEQELQSSVVA